MERIQFGHMKTCSIPRSSPDEKLLFSSSFLSCKHHKTILSTKSSIYGKNSISWLYKDKTSGRRHRTRTWKWKFKDGRGRVCIHALGILLFLEDYLSFGLYFSLLLWSIVKLLRPPFFTCSKCEPFLFRMVLFRTLLILALNTYVLSILE